MREIKFRAWDKRKQIMKHFCLDDASAINDVPHSYFGGFDTSEGEIYSHDLPNDGLSENEKCVLMQYTGLKDKNGKEIYEGDIIKTPVGSLAKVIWDEMGAYFLAGFFPEFEGGERCAGFRSYHSWLCEVIGNIFENKELLEK